jgi:cob(I)alamin adenosyltransferase
MSSRDRRTSEDNTGRGSKFSCSGFALGSLPVQPQDQEIERHLAAVQEHLDQCRAALATVREGDAAAMEALSAEVDAMASTVAELKAASAAPAL